MMRIATLAVALLLLMSDGAARTHSDMQYFLPDSYSTMRELTPLCAGLDSIQIGNPKNCQKFIVCCNSEPFPFVCHLPPTPGYDIYEYSPSILPGAASYDPVAGRCKSIPAPSTCLPNVLDPKPSRHICNRVAAREVIEGSITYKRLYPVKEGAYGVASQGDDPFTIKSPMDAEMENITTTTGSALARRQLATFSPGSFKLIINQATGKSSTGALAIHAMLVPKTDEVLMASRPINFPMLEYEPGMRILVGNKSYGQVSSLYDTNTGTYVVQPVSSAPFCMAQSHLKDGTIITGGGDPAYGEDLQAGPMIEGRNRIRRYTKATGWVDSQAKLSAFHWYPTMLTLPDQRVIITNGVENPGIGGAQPLEVYDANTDTLVSSSAETPMKGFYLYPALFLLPWTPTAGTYFMYAFSCQTGKLMTIAQDNNVKLYRNLPSPGLGAFCSQSSAQGTATLLKMKASNGYAAEVVQFGGFGFAQGKTCKCDTPATSKSLRMKLDKTTVTANLQRWVSEDMPGGRTGGDCVLLPNGKIVIVNGAANGQMGGGLKGGSSSNNPVLNAWLYNPDAPVNQRYTVLAASPIYRFYHSIALLLPDASVLIAGSEQSVCVSGCFVSPPAFLQYQAEKYLPYYFDSALRPTIIEAGNPSSGKMGSTITLQFSGTAGEAVLVSPAAVTHQLNMNQRVVGIGLTQGPKVGELNTAKFRLPGNDGRVAPPGMYMLFIMNGDIPCKKAIWFQLLM